MGFYEYFGSGKVERKSIEKLKKKPIVELLIVKRSIE